MTGIEVTRHLTASIERRVELGKTEGAVDGLVNAGVDVSSDEAVDSHGGFTDARRFSLTGEFRRDKRRLQKAVEGIVGYNPNSAGRPRGLAVVQLPDNLDPVRRTLRYLDVSAEDFRGLEEDEFCIKAVTAAATSYLTLGAQVRDSLETVRA